MIEVEGFTPDPTHGRPRLVEFRGREGRLSVHVERETKALWLFASGPKDGDRGHVVFPVTMAARLVEWLAGGMRNAAPSTTGVLWIEGPRADERMVVVAKDALHRSKWQMQFDPKAESVLTTLLREWAEKALAHG